MKSLMKYLKDYKKECVLSPLFKLLEATFELFVPLVMAAVIDKGIGHADKPYIVKMCLVLIALGIIGLVCSITAQFFAAKAAVGFATKLRHALFGHIQSLSFSEIDTLGTSTLITRMTSDVNQVQNGVNLVLRLLLRSPFVVVGAMVMAFTIDVKAALIFVVAIPLLCIVVFAIMFVSIPLYKKVQAGLDRVLLGTRENLTGVRVIRAFNKEKDEVERFNESNAALNKIQMYVGRISALMNPITYIIINGGIVALIYVGAIRVDSGAISQGQVVALVNYMSQILVEVVKVANLIISCTKALASANRIESIFDVKASVCDKTEVMLGDNSSEYAVEFNNVYLKYKDAGEDALSNIDFKVKRGETVGIIGGTGCGKSSIVNLIPRFYDATGGEVKVNGVNVKDQPVEKLRDIVGMVMQKAVLFKGTIRDNMKWGNENATDAEIYEALDISQSREFVEQKPDKLDEMIEQGGKNLSGGQKQRLTIARALVKKPQILILDDSASALDFATDAKLRKAIASMEGKMTVFIVSQRTSSIQHADKIVVLDDGQIVMIGTHEELLEKCEEYREIHYSQISKDEKGGK
ncbi:MAG: ABC transporter ATP-binding protein [Lachnospiraceae bacterium]|nr:ABC transporter ATP-binding protein/permease [Clostridiales bacterium]MDD6293827.1 ABC transporter ATP-binding protein [Eubacteriales bacterium]MDY2607903.1 ABC transporter ATP-binding protein [Lachnospiraceae bacterium]